MAVHRYKATESTGDEPAAETKKKAPKKVEKTVVKTVKKADKAEKPKRKPYKIFAPFRALNQYFVGSWQELKLVHWPNRKQTWAMTLAVLLFSVAIGALIFGLDALFTLLFKKFIF